jgi:hypothetical protein
MPQLPIRGDRDEISHFSRPAEPNGSKADSSTTKAGFKHPGPTAGIQKSQRTPSRSLCAVRLLKLLIPKTRLHYFRRAGQWVSLFYRKISEVLKREYNAHNTPESDFPRTTK